MRDLTSITLIGTIHILPVVAANPEMRSIFGSAAASPRGDLIHAVGELICLPSASAKSTAILQQLVPAIALAAVSHSAWEFPTFGLFPGDPNRLSINSNNFSDLDTLFRSLMDSRYVMLRCLDPFRMLMFLQNDRFASESMAAKPRSLDQKNKGGRTGGPKEGTSIRVS